MRQPWAGLPQQGALTKARTSARAKSPAWTEPTPEDPKGILGFSKAEVKDRRVARQDALILQLNPACNRRLG